MRVNFDNEKSVTDGLTTDRFTSAAAKTADGYLVEIAIPSTFGGFTAGQIVGFDAQINDDGDGEGKRTSIANWFDLSGMGYTDVSGLGLLRLLGEGEAPEAGTTYGDVDENGEVALLDVIALNKNLLGMTKISDQAMKNADVDRSGNVDGTDSLYILKSLVSLVTLPV